jgi:hypothetical protein
MHVLRHTDASVLLDAGESIKALAAYLGHTDPGFTLRVYTHLLPNSEDRTRRAIDRAFEDDPEPDDGLDTAWAMIKQLKSQLRAGARRHFQRKCTKSRPKLCESFSTRW